MIEKVHVVNATSMTMDERFTQLAASNHIGPRRKRPNTGNFQYQPVDYWSRDWLEEFSRQLEQAKEQFREQMSNRLGYRRRGNGYGMPGLRRSNSLSNLSQRSFGRQSWRQSNGDLSSNRSVSWGRASSAGGSERAYKRTQRNTRGRSRGRQNRGGGNNNNGWMWGRPRRAPGVGRGGIRRNTQRGRGRAAQNGQRVTRSQAQKTVPSKEELDAQLDLYMAGTKAALDKELDEYMKNAMELD